MPFIPVDAEHLLVALQNDAQQWRTTIAWAQQRYKAYSTNLTTDAMTALNIGETDQNAILGFIGDLNRFNELAAGTVPANAQDMMTVLAGILGVM